MQVNIDSRELERLRTAANCAPDLVRRIAALRDGLKHLGDQVFQQSPWGQAMRDLLDADDAACATMKVGDE